MTGADKGPWFPKALEYVLSYSATLREPEVIGPLPEGLRLNFYITGGSFEGPNCKGTLLPVGADWLTIRTDGIGILDVRATFKTDDGALIYTQYSGVLEAGKDGYQKALDGKLPDIIPLRVCSRMHTVHPKYQWLNRHQFMHFGEANLPTLTVRYHVTRGHFTWPRHCTMATRGSSTPVTGRYAALQHISAMGTTRSGGTIQFRPELEVELSTLGHCGRELYPTISSQYSRPIWSPKAVDGDGSEARTGEEGLLA